MTNLDSILNSRDITLPTKVHLVKAMVFPVVRYGCESWTIKKAEHRRIDAFFFLSCTDFFFLIYYYYYYFTLQYCIGFNITAVCVTTHASHPKQS